MLAKKVLAVVHGAVLGTGRVLGRQGGDAEHLARALGITTASTTSLIDRLARDGYLVRENDPTDRRSIVLVPTAQAMAPSAGPESLIQQILLDATVGLNDTEAERIVEVLRRLARALDGIDADALTEPQHGGS